MHETTERWLGLGVIGVAAIVVVAWFGFEKFDPTLTYKERQQYVIVDNADGVRNHDRFFPQQSRCVVWRSAALRTHTIDDTLVVEVVSNPSESGESCPPGTQYHHAQRW